MNSHSFASKSDENRFKIIFSLKIATKSILPCKFPHSSLIGRDNYIGFYIDWFIETTGGSVFIAVIILSASIYIGIFLYVNGMTTDMKMRLISIEIGSTLRPRCRPLSQSEKWWIYVQEIQFHGEIIEYVDVLYKNDAI